MDSAKDSFDASEALLKWGKDEMNFPSAHQADVRKLAPLCKGSAMLGLWDRVINRVKSKSQAEHIRQNIKLSELTVESEGLASSVEKKSRTLKAAENDIESLQLQLKQHKEELQESQLKLLNVEQNDQFLEMKSCMYRNHQKYIKKRNEGLKSFSQWISDICMAYEQRPGATECEELESQCGKHLENIFHLMHGKNPSQTYASIGELVKHYHPKLILSSLTRQCEGSTESIKDEEERFEFSSDLEKLESQYLNDERIKTADLATIRTMLNQWDLDFINGFAQSQMCRQNEEEMLLQIEQERSSIISQLEAQYEFEPSKLQLAIDLLDAEVEFATLKGSEQSFQASIARLEQDIHLKEQTRDQLYAVKAKIDSFSDTVSKNQGRIIEITKHNAAIKSRVCDRQTQILGITKAQICEKNAEVARVCSDIQTALSERLTSFSHVDLGKLWQVDIQPGVPCQVNRLSIYKGLDISQTNGKGLLEVAQCLNIHGHVPVSAILQKAIGAKREVSRNKLLKETFVNETLSDDKLRVVCDLLEEGRKVEKDQIQAIEEKYKEGVSILEFASKQCQLLDQQIETWCEQPAQYQTPWLTAEGVSLKEWKNRIENPPTQTT